MFKVVDESFPLKDISVRGSGDELNHYLTIYQDNERKIYEDMVQLRKEFGTLKYSPNGERILLSIWQVGESQPNTATQIRWMIHDDGKNSFPITTPVLENLEKRNAKAGRLIQTIKKIKRLPQSYEKFIEYEKRRIEVNARSKVNKRTLQCLQEVESIRCLERILSAIIDNTAPT